MPFDEAFEDVYKLGIKPACQAAGAYCERVDEQIFDERILDRIYNQIAKADLVVADMTDRNPNVFYEVGYAHALGKLTILLTKNADDIPFDLKHFPHIVYGTKISVLKEELEKRVRYFVENPPSKPSDIKLGLELFLEGQSLASGKPVYTHGINEIPHPQITVFNTSSDTFAPGDFKIGILTSEAFSSSNLFGRKAVACTKLPVGGYLHMLPDFPMLFPSAYASCEIIFNVEPGEYWARGEVENLTVRLFTKQGHRDFPATIRLEGLN
jgi:hypothetical protein